MTCEHQFVQALKESGNRPAPRRLVILSAVRRADGRIAASDALRRVQRSYSFIDASTVYRTRLASETRVGGGDRLSCEWIDARGRHHPVREGCDMVVEPEDGFADSVSADMLRACGFDARARRPAPFGRRRDRQRAARETETADR